MHRLPREPRSPPGPSSNPRAPRVITRSRPTSDFPQRNGSRSATALVKEQSTNAEIARPPPLGGCCAPAPFRSLTRPSRAHAPTRRSRCTTARAKARDRYAFIVSCPQRNQPASRSSPSSDPEREGFSRRSITASGLRPVAIARDGPGAGLPSERARRRFTRTPAITSRQMHAHHRRLGVRFAKLPAAFRYNDAVESTPGTWSTRERRGARGRRHARAPLRAAYSGAKLARLRLPRFTRAPRGSRTSATRSAAIGRGAPPPPPGGRAPPRPRGGARTRAEIAFWASGAWLGLPGTLGLGRADCTGGPLRAAEKRDVKEYGGRGRDAAVACTRSRPRWYRACSRWQKGMGPGANSVARSSRTGSRAYHDVEGAAPARRHPPHVLAVLRGERGLSRVAASTHVNPCPRAATPRVAARGRRSALDSSSLRRAAKQPLRARYVEDESTSRSPTATADQAIPLVVKRRSSGRQLRGGAEEARSSDIRWHARLDT